MLRTERTRLALVAGQSGASPHTLAGDLLIAVAPPPQTHVFDLSGWPTWLIPTYRSGGQRLSSRFREEERR